MKYKLSLLLFFTLASFGFAQVDSNSGSSEIIPVEEETTETNTTVEPIKVPSLTTPNENAVNGLSVPQRNTIEPKKREFSMFGETFGNPGELYEKQVDKHLNSYTKIDDESTNNGSTTNQYLGDFKTKASKVNIIYRDHQYPDGDLIRVLVNDDIVRPSVLLQQWYNGFKLDLISGLNKIDFLALNQGESGPNTAEFQILDEAGNVISTNTWNLATGVKATIILIKE